MFPWKEILFITVCVKELFFFSFSHRKHRLIIGKSSIETAHVVARYRYCFLEINSLANVRYITHVETIYRLPSYFIYVANLRNDGHIGRRESRDTGGTATILKDGASCKPCNLHPRKGKAVEKTQTTTTTHVSFPLVEPYSPIGIPHHPRPTDPVQVTASLLYGVSNVWIAKLFLKSIYKLNESWNVSSVKENYRRIRTNKRMQLKNVLSWGDKI